jgi:magnesium transporter
MSDTASTSAIAAEVLGRRYMIDFPVQAALSIETMTPAEAAACLERLPIPASVPVWNAIASGFAAAVLRAMTPSAQHALIAELDRSRGAEFLSLLEDDEREAILAGLPPSLAQELRDLLSYPEDSAGRVMDTRVFAVHGHLTVRQVTDMLMQRRQTNVYFVKVVDGDHRLLSQADVRDLAFAAPDTPISDIAKPVPAVVNALDPRDELAETFTQLGLREMPVVDVNGRVIGIIRHDRLIGVLRDDATLDIQTMVGAGKDERAMSSSWLAVRKRMPWLQINLLTAFMAASVVGLFEGTIAKFTALAVLLPVVAGQSGNAGAQALAVTMRGLALREIHVGQWPRIVLKEINAGFWNGVAIAITCAIGVYVWSGSPGLVLVIVLSMLISMVAAGVAGALVPVTLRRLGQDPAVASSIILTTVTDIAGFFSFLGIATLLAGMLA